MKSYNQIYITKHDIFITDKVPLWNVSYAYKENALHECYYLKDIISKFLDHCDIMYSFRDWEIDCYLRVAMYMSFNTRHKKPSEKDREYFNNAFNSLHYILRDNLFEQTNISGNTTFYLNLIQSISKFLKENLSNMDWYYDNNSQNNMIFKEYENIFKMVCALGGNVSNCGPYYNEAIDDFIVLVNQDRKNGINRSESDNLSLLIKCINDKKNNDKTKKINKIL